MRHSGDTEVQKSPKTEGFCGTFGRNREPGPILWVRSGTLKVGLETKDPAHRWDPDPKDETQDPGPLLYIGPETQDTERRTWKTYDS